MFYIDSIQSILTFDWFKENYICKDQPWVCDFDESHEDLMRLEQERTDSGMSHETIESWNYYESWNCIEILSLNQPKSY